MISHGSGPDVSTQSCRLSTLPATLSEYGLVETLWARHIVASLYHSLRYSIPRTDVLGRWGSPVDLPFPLFDGGFLCRSGILAQLLDTFASKRRHIPCRLQQFVRHNTTRCSSSAADFLFRQHMSVRSLINQSLSVYREARHEYSMTGKSNGHLQVTADYQRFSVQNTCIAIGTLYSCPFSGQMLFGDDSGK